jgi:hypothetical protein
MSMAPPGGFLGELRHLSKKVASPSLSWILHRISVQGISSNFSNNFAEESLIPISLMGKVGLKDSKITHNGQRQEGAEHPMAGTDSGTRVGSEDPSLLDGGWGEL